MTPVSKTRIAIMELKNLILTTIGSIRTIFPSCTFDTNIQYPLIRSLCSKMIHPVSQGPKGVDVANEIFKLKLS